jgi:hypothetical protein
MFLFDLWDQMKSLLFPCDGVTSQELRAFRLLPSFAKGIFLIPPGLIEKLRYGRQLFLLDEI